MKFTTTAKKLEDAGIPSARIAILRESGASSDEPIDLLTILDELGTEDCLSALMVTNEDSLATARLISADIAELVLPLFEALRPGDASAREAIEATRKLARGEITAEQWRLASVIAQNAANRCIREADDFAWACVGWMCSQAAATDCPRDAFLDACKAHIWAMNISNDIPIAHFRIPAFDIVSKHLEA